MEVDKVCDLENCDPNDVWRLTISPNDRPLALADALVLPLINILANVQVAEAQAAKGVSINQTAADGRTVSAYFTETDKKDAPAVILIHGWESLINKMRTVADAIHVKRFHAIAIDLFNRSVATNLDEAKSKSKTLKASEANETNAA